MIESGALLAIVKIGGALAIASQVGRLWQSFFNKKRESRERERLERMNAETSASSLSQTLSSGDVITMHVDGVKTSNYTTSKST